MWYVLLANAVITLHIAYVAFIVIGEFAILLGGVYGWNWVRNRIFRISHLVSIAIVALESVTGITCPLTLLEKQLRAWSGREVAAGTFTHKELYNVFFHNVPFNLVRATYFASVLLVIFTWVAVPPRPRCPAGRTN